MLFGLSNKSRPFTIYIFLPIHFLVPFHYC